MQGIFRKENTDKALKYGIYRHLPTYEKIIRNLVSFYWKNLNLAERRIVMKFINTRKFTWIICIIGFLLALVSIFFLPSIIPVHFANGIADDYGRKIQIFLFPILQVLITFLTGREKVKYCLTHSKTFLTDIQFNWMIDGVLLLVMFAEIWVIYASFA